MSRTRSFEGSLRRTLAQAEDFTRCGQPYPPWLEKKQAGIHLMVTDMEAGFLLFSDGERDEDDALLRVWYSRFPDSIQAEEDANPEAKLPRVMDGLEADEGTDQDAE